MPSLDEATVHAEAPRSSILRIPENSERKESEIFWVTLQPFLASCGYTLRPRYQADWAPSWQSNPKPRKFGVFYEDEHIIHYGHWRIIDATRISDGCKVVLKVVQRFLPDDFELEIIQFLSSAELKDDPRNRAIPLLDIIQPSGENWVLIVMPMFHPFASPNFHCIIISESLEFMHSLNIAHRDISINNVLMDHRCVIPNGFHFAMDDSHDGVTRGLCTELRCRVAPVNYYYIDFEFDQRFPEGIEKATVSGIVGQRVPEMKISDDVPYNPFKADVYQLGKTMLMIFEDYTGLGNFKGLLKKMVSRNPDKRPTASEALSLLDALVSRMSKSSMHWRIWNTPYLDPTFPPIGTRLMYYLFPSRRALA
ncbi:hypothetical protein ARMSODRAFT_937159 [Armillaria solidipes]|uniref:Protein kinase domain-containing protein n=1 Tax=Armillaria solidipes TaxID=1076256 RepID=A0A2H3BNQ9_9AGAR|nr:hypothetical protein ARMSODRAFT_937159 [Armillaria solidipes]